MASFDNTAGCYSITSQLVMCLVIIVVRIL